MSNWDLKQDDESIDLNEIIKISKDILKKLTLKDFIIILLILMMFLIYIISQKDIEACNFYYQELLKNTTQLATSLW